MHRWTRGEAGLADPQFGDRHSVAVNVPVLSVHRIVAAPKASMAEARRVRTRAPEIRHAPITMKTLSTRGNSSGNIDISRAMPARSASSQEPRSNP